MEEFEQIEELIEKAICIDLKADIDKYNLDPEESCKQTTDVMKRMGNDLQFSIDYIKRYIEQGFTVLDFLPIFYPLYKSIFNAFTSILYLYRTCYCSLTYDCFDEFVSVEEELVDKLKEFVDLQEKTTDLFGIDIQFKNLESEQLLRLMESSYETEPCNDVDSVDGFLNSMKFYGGKMPLYVQLIVYQFNIIVYKFRKYRIERKNSELAFIYNHRKDTYKSHEFSKEWDRYRKRVIEHDLKFKELNSSNLLKVRESFLQLFENTTLGKVWYEYDGDEELAYQISREQVSKKVFDAYLRDLCILEALDQWIKDLKTDESNLDNMFKSWVDIPALKESLIYWIQSNIDKQEQWVVVYVAMKEACIIKSNVDPEEWSMRMERMFDSSNVKCKYESFRKLLPKKPNKNKIHTLSLDQWNENTPYYAMTKSLCTKLKKSKVSFTKESF